MEDLEKFLSLLVNCNVDFDKDELRCYLFETYGEVKSKEENRHSYEDIMYEIIDVYCEALHKKFAFDSRKLKLNINKEYQQINLEFEIDDEW